MKKKNIIAIALSALLAFGAASCSTENNVQRELTEEELKKIASSIPDYSSSTEKFEFFGYSAADDGYWVDDGNTYYVGEDLRTVENFTLYKDCGLTFMHPQESAGILQGDHFTFATSNIKKVMDVAEEAGIGRVIVPDHRITALAATIVSSGLKAYESQNADEINTFNAQTDIYDIFDNETCALQQDKLDALIISFMEEYSQHPAFYGVQLPDEPSPKVMNGIAVVYDTIKRLYPEAFILSNIFPPAGFPPSVWELESTATPEQIAEFAHTGRSEQFANWKNYLIHYLDTVKIDYLMYDSYPITEDGIHFSYVLGLQIAAEVCKEKGVDFYVVSQSTTRLNNRFLDEGAVSWLNNMQIGLGVKTIGYYTYYDRDTSDYVDGSSFVNHFGEPNDLYYIMQKKLKQNHQFAPTVLSFEYQESSVISVSGGTYVSQYIQNGMTTGKFAKVSDIELDKEAALVSELYDKKNDRYMYMVENIVDPMYTGSKSWQTATLKFNTEYKYAVVWKNGESTVIRLADNQYTISQHPGDAVYVIPFNA